jgi:PRTRC genetic system ThiF family protein
MRNSKKTKRKTTQPKAKLDLFASAPHPLQLQVRPFQTVRLTLVGCGGTGSHIATGLAALALELRSKDIACEICLVDHDVIEPKNVGRQLFAQQEVGRFKSLVLGHRLTQAYGVPVDYATFGIQDYNLSPHAGALNVVIGAVDNPAARAVIAKAVDAAKGDLWWLNTGNENASGQVALGNTGDMAQMRNAIQLGMTQRIPAPHVLYPDCIAIPKVKPGKRAASCAELTASGEQGLMVNRMVAAWALELLNAFLIRKSLNWFALAFDLVWGNTTKFIFDAPTLARADVTGLTVKELGA